MSEVAGTCNRSWLATGFRLTLQKAYLKFSNINFRTVPSNNHASPSGALPFVLPASPDPVKPTQPVPSGKLQRWAMNNSETAIEESGDLRYEAYLSLLDHRIRRAWVGYLSIIHKACINVVRSSTAYTSRTTSLPSPNRYTSFLHPAIHSSA